MARDPRTDPLRSTGDGAENPRSHSDPNDRTYGRKPFAEQDPDVSRSRMFDDYDPAGAASYDLPNIGDGSGKFQHADVDRVGKDALMGTNEIPHGTSAAFNVAEHITVNVDHARPGDRFGNNDANRRSEPSSYIKSLIDAQADESTDYPDQA